MSSAAAKRDPLAALRGGQSLNLRQQLALVLRLSLPAMMSQISTIIMEYIDASMVGRLGPAQSASIGLVSTSTWLFGGVCFAASAGFTVQVAQCIGAGQEREARDILKQAFAVCLGISILLLAGGAAVSGGLPRWLGGEQPLWRDASLYFLIFMLGIPISQLNSLAGGMLQCSGNMRVPSLLNVLMCTLDMVFNAALIFPARTVTLFGTAVFVPGAGLGVAGAALGTVLAQAVTAVFMLWFLLRRSPPLHLRPGEGFAFSGPCLKKAVRIAAPVAFEHVVMCGAQVAATRIVAPLGTVSIAANSFAVTAESLCYMPGYGIADAATTLIGQSIGAGRPQLSRRFAWMTVGIGMAVMTCTGVLLYAFAPAMLALLTPSAEIRALGASVLRIEAFAEPLFAASIVASGAFRGAGDTLVPSCMNLISMWAVRLPAAALLAPVLGLRGVWIAMCAELCVRGLLFLARLKSSRWLKRIC
jgi:putative MATE family efflux protein